MADQAVTPEQVEAVKAAIPPAVYKALIAAELTERRKKHDPRAPYRDVVSGRAPPRMRPKSSPGDRRLVPAALRHWRTVHGISYREAQERVGYSRKSCSWQHWESGYAAPPYEVLLRIIAATGLGHWVDDDSADVDPTLLLERRTALNARRRRRRSQPSQPASS